MTSKCSDLMIPRSYSPEYREELLLLLDEAFGAEYRDYYVQQVEHWSRYAPEQMRLGVDPSSGELLAYLLSAEYHQAASGERYAYLYCVCTLRCRRGEGIMSHLMHREIARLRAEGYSGILLIPSSKSLVGYYEHFGFKKMETPIYTAAPTQELSSLIEPGSVVASYIGSLPESEPDYPTERDAGGGVRLCPPAGWMLLPLRESIPDHLVLLKPLT